MLTLKLKSLNVRKQNRNISVMHKQISEVIHKNVDKVRNMCIVLLITMGVYAKISKKTCLLLQEKVPSLRGG